VKTMQMTVEGAKGWANIARREVAGKAVIGIRGDGAAGLFGLNVDTRDERSQQYAAARLQRELDGYQGTAGDVAGYLRAIQTFADGGDQHKEPTMKTTARKTENMLGTARPEDASAPGRRRRPRRAGSTASIGPGPPGRTGGPPTGAEGLGRSSRDAHSPRSRNFFFNQSSSTLSWPISWYSRSRRASSSFSTRTRPVEKRSARPSRAYFFHWPTWTG
jgi:hypothetical protein